MSDARAWYERLMWVSSLHSYGVMHEAVTQLTGFDYNSDDVGYAENELSRRNRDFVHASTLTQWFAVSSGLQ